METTQVNWVSRVGTLIATLNTVAMAFGLYHLSNDQYNAVLAAVSAVFAIWGTWKNH